MLASMFRKKSLTALRAAHAAQSRPLKKVLGFWTLTALGVGCTIGAGIFVMPGVVAATTAGPAVVLSFLLAAVACALAALSYCELAVMIPASGSAYSYSYVALGELVAWLIGWDLLLEYGLSNSAVAAGWGGYLNRLFMSVGYHIPERLLYAPGQVIPGSAALGILNLPAAVAIGLVTLFMLLGIRESARANAVLVAAKIAVLSAFLFFCAPHVDASNMTPFMPFGWNGVVGGAAILFFLFIGFDAISTVAEETENPQRDMPRAILAALAVVTVLYVSVGLVLTGVMPLDQLKIVKDPLAHALALFQHPVAAWILSLVAVGGILSIILVGAIGQSRILYVMSRDGLMPRFMANVSARTGAPVETTLILGAVTAVLAAAVPLEQLADLVSIGTLAAFCLVSVSVIVLRYTQPDAPRSFRCPWVPVLPLAGIAINLYLMADLKWEVWERFFIWIAIGLGVYLLWGRHSADRVFTPDEEALPPPLMQ